MCGRRGRNRGGKTGTGPGAMGDEIITRDDEEKISVSAKGRIHHPDINRGKKIGLM